MSKPEDPNAPPAPKTGPVVPSGPGTAGASAGSAAPMAAGRLLSLTSLRAFAALAVFSRHASESFFAIGDASPLTRQGAAGVSFFFILSGFVLTWSARPGDGRAGFYRRRFARIYPAYLTMLVLTQVAAGVRHGFPLVPFLLNASLLQAWVPSAHVYFSSDMGAWSLGCEAFFYALFPFLLPKVLGASGRRRRQLLAAVLLADLALCLALHSGEQSHGVALWVVYVLPVTRIGEFLTGMVLAAAVKDGMRSPLSLNQALLLALAGYGVAGLVPVYLMWVVITFVPFALLIVTAATWENEGRRTWLTKAPIVRLGQWSFAFYLVHISVLYALHHVIPTRGGVPGLGLTGVALVLSVMAAWGLFRLVERPMERRLRDGASRARRRTWPVRLRLGIR